MFLFTKFLLLLVVLSLIVIPTKVYCTTGGSSTSTPRSSTIDDEAETEAEAGTEVEVEAKAKAVDGVCDSDNINNNDDDNDDDDDDETKTTTSTLSSSSYQKNNIDELYQLWNSVYLYDVLEWMGCNDDDDDNDDDPESSSDENRNMKTSTSRYNVIPNEKDYKLMVEAYKYSMKKNNYDNNNNDDDDDERRNMAHTITVTEYNPNSFIVPVEVRMISPSIGRGVFALEDISKGTLIWRPSNAAEFPTKETYRDFFVYLIQQDATHLGCDVLIWAYTTRINKNKFIACADFDPSSLINSADGGVVDEDDYDHNDDMDEYTMVEYENANIGELDTNVHGEERTVYGCQVGSIYALRNIKAGEELRMSYSDFVEPGGWEEMGIFYSF